MAGPVIRGKYESLGYDVAALFGVDQNAPDANVTINLEYEF